MASINEFALLLGLKPKSPTAVSSNRNLAAEIGTQRGAQGTGTLGEYPVKLYPYNRPTQSSEMEVYFSNNSVMAPTCNTSYLYNTLREGRVSEHNNLPRSTFCQQENVTSYLPGSMTFSPPIQHLSLARLSKTPTFYTDTGVYTDSVSRRELAYGDRCTASSTNKVSSHRYDESENDLSLKKFSSVLFCKTKQICTLTEDSDPHHETVLVTGVFASSRHPLFGYKLDITDVQVIYDDKGFIRVIQTPYLAKGIYKVMPNGSKSEHPDFPGHFRQLAHFIRCQSIDKSEPDIRYLVIKDTVPVPSSVSQYRDLAASEYGQFINSANFQAYTLPVILGCGNDNIWVSMMGFPDAHPVCLKEKENYNLWKFFENNMPTASRDGSGTAWFQQYMNQKFENWDSVSTESEYLRLKHDALCYGCSECMDREQYIACVRQRSDYFVSSYSRKGRIRYKSAVRKRGSRKRRFSRSKSSAAKRTCKTTEKSTKKLKIISGHHQNQEENAKQTVLNHEPLDISLGSTSSSPPTSPGSNSSSECSSTSPEATERSKRKRKRKLICDCPGCDSGNDSGMKAARHNDLPKNKSVTDTLQNTRSN